MKHKLLIAAIALMSLLLVACQKNMINTPSAEQPGSSIAAANEIWILPFWRTRADFPGGGRYHAISFNLLGKGYIGGGDNRDFLFPKYDFWCYDPATNTWTQKASIPNGERVGAACFAINGKGYISTGFTISDPHMYFGSKSDTWMYDPLTNVWTAKANFPGGPRGGAVGMTIDGKGYVGTGAFHNNLLTGDTFYRDWWQYNPLTDTWTRKADFPGAARCYASGVGVSNAGYLGAGNNQFFTTGFNFSDWYSYNSGTNTWTLKSSKAFAPRNSAVAFTIAKKIYFGTGTTGDPIYGGLSTAKSDMARYDPIANTWTALSSLPSVRSGAAGFAIGDSIYVGTGFSPQFYSLTIN